MTGPRHLATALGLAAIPVTACTGQVGTIQISIVTAPGSAVLDPVTTLRATLTTPPRTLEAPRGPDGFSIELEVDADSRSGSVILEGLDAAGGIVAVGASPPLPLIAIDADVAIYMAPPQSLAAAPVALDPPRAEIGSVLLPYGVLLAGGAAATGPTADLEIYSAYDHDLIVGEDLPAARRGMAVGFSNSGYAYLFGGTDAAGTASGTAWRFDTNAQPAGTYATLDDEPTLARTGENAAPLGSEQFLVSGEPAVVMNGLSGLTAVTTITRLAPIMVSVQNTALESAPIYTVSVGVTAGDTGIIELTSGAFTSVSAPPDALRSGHGAVPTPQAQIVAIGGSTIADGLVRNALRIDPATRTTSSIPDVLAAGRNDAAVATNGEILLVAGGTDGAGSVLPDAEVIDLASLAPIASVAMVVPRTKALARPLPNGQILIAGGIDASGAPVGTIELFTPTITP